MTHKERGEAFLGERNPFWKQTLSSWKKLLKNTDNGIQDRTTGTRYRDINETLDTAQGGFGFRAKNKSLRVEILFKTLPKPKGIVITQFKSWEELRSNLSKENHLNHVVYHRMMERYKYLIPIINQRRYLICR